VSALEYNKVMRLLQNREFPVDREEIVAVAANAYELSEAECRSVIDLAVDRGLLDEEDGSLARPDG
jgi:predicted nucleic-acid-binding protein